MPSESSEGPGPREGQGPLWSALGRRTVYMQRRLKPAPWSPPLSGAGIQAFSRRKPGRKEWQGVPPCTPWNQTARWGSLHLLGWWPLERSLSGKSAPDQIWIRIFGEYVLAGYCSAKNPAIENPTKESPQIRVRTWVAVKRTVVPLRLYPKRWSERVASGLENRGPGAQPLVFFPPFLTGEMEAAGRHPPGALRPEASKSLDHL